MSGRILSDVSAEVGSEREDDLIAGYREVGAGPKPDGLLRSELLKGPHRWHVQTVWRDQSALDAMRATGEPPAAPRLFRSVGAEPTLELLEVVADISAVEGHP